MSTGDGEDVEGFRSRARVWIEKNLPEADDPAEIDDTALQNAIFDAGFAGIAYPVQYGGAGLTFEHQRAFFDEATGRRVPMGFGVSIGMLGPTLLDFGSEALKASHLPRILRGDELWIQLLSEPTGGSDMAGALTRLTRDGDTYVVNGSKMWSTGALYSDFGMCLARTNWDVPKHDGLTMFLVPIKHPGITLRRITQLNGSTEFCEEFLDGVDVGDDAVVGEVDGGWAVASRQLYHERRAVGMSSEFASGSGSEGGRSTPVNYVALTKMVGQADNERAQQMAGRALVHRAVSEQLGGHVYRSVRDGTLPPAAGTLIRLFHAETTTLEMDTGLAITGTAGVVGAEGEGLQAGLRYLARQAVCMGGGTTEMARNVIGERVLNFPREYAADRGVPFNQVRHGN